MTAFPKSILTILTLTKMTTDCKYKTMCIWKCYLLHMLIPMTKPLPWFRVLVLTLTICNIFMIEVIDSEYTQESANETNWKHNSSNNKINGSLEKNQGGNEMLPPSKNSNKFVFLLAYSNFGLALEGTFARKWKEKQAFLLHFARLFVSF